MNSFSEEEDKDAKARRVVRANNFTQQTNVLDVDKHMYVILPYHPPLSVSNVANMVASGWRTLKRT